MEATQSIDSRVGYVPAFIRQSDIERLDTLRICPDPRDLQEERVLELTDYIGPAPAYTPVSMGSTITCADSQKEIQDNDPILSVYRKMALHEGVEKLLAVQWSRVHQHYIN